MGACDFATTASGATMKLAFAAAHAQAQYEDGAGGYSGTIAEKYEFVDGGKPPAGTSLDDLADVLEGWFDHADAGALRLWFVETHGVARMDAMASAYDDKWGPAIGFELGTTEHGPLYGFIGMASS